MDKVARTHHVLVAKDAPSPVGWLRRRLQARQVIRQVREPHGVCRGGPVAIGVGRLLRRRRRRRRLSQLLDARDALRRKVGPKGRRVGKRRRERVRFLVGHGGLARVRGAWLAISSTRERSGCSDAVRVDDAASASALLDACTLGRVFLGQSSLDGGGWMRLRWDAGNVVGRVFYQPLYRYECRCGGNPRCGGPPGSKWQRQAGSRRVIAGRGHSRINSIESFS